MAETLGTARLNLTVDTSDFRAQIEASKNITTGLGTEAQQAFAKAEGGSRRASESFLRYVRGLQNGVEEQKILNAAMRGVPVEILDEARKIILQQRDATAAAAAETARLAQQTKIAADAQRRAAELQSTRTDFVRNLEQQVRAIGKTRVELLEMRAAELGVEASARPLIAALRAQEQALEANSRKAQVATKEFNQYGLSQKQVTAAMRGVPAQITDIFISLQGGQNPLTVLLQQGGQLKDMFGGIVPAARALAGAIAGLVNPYTIAAVAVGGLGAAYLSAEQRANAFNEALIMSGQSGTISADDLQRYAEELDNISGITSRQAADALTQVAASGKIAADQYSLVAQAASAMQNVTGKAMKDTIAEYAELARDPYNAIMRFNEAENFLTASIAQRIKVLQESGRIEEAIALATETRANAQIERTGQVVESLGLVTGAWHDIKRGTAEAWDEAVSYFANLDRDAKEAVGTLGRLMQSFRMGGIGGMWGMQQALMPSAALDQKAVEEQRRVSKVTLDMWDAIEKGNLSREEQQKLEIERIRNLGKEANKTEKQIQEAIAASEAAYKRNTPKGASTVSMDNAARSAGLQAIKDAATQEQALVQNNSRILQAEYSARTISVESYYKRQRELLEQGTRIEADSLAKQIAFLRSRNTSGKESIDVQKQIGQLEAQLAKARADGATQLAVLDIQEKAVLATRQRAIESYRDALNDSIDAQQAQVNAQIAAIMFGEREAEMQTRLAKVYADAAKERRRLAQQFQENNDEKLYQENLRSLEAAVEREVEVVRSGYARMDEAQANWLNGVNAGIRNWMSQATNVAQQTQAIVGNALDGLAQGFVNLATSGKSSFKELLADILKQIVQFLAKQAVLQFIQYFASSFGGGGNSNVNTGGNTKASTPTKFAMGGAMQGPGISKFSSTVVDKPTQFFANGGNVMGEAGPEGILPLKRTSDGKLGVMAAGGSGTVNLSVATIINSDGSASSDTKTDGGNEYREFSEHMKNICNQEIQRAIRPGGMLWRAGVRANG